MRLDDVPVPVDVEERSWRVVRDAFEARTPNPRRPTIRPSFPVTALAVVATLVITAVALSASGAGVVDNIRHALGVRNAAAVLVRLPTSGRLLVNSSDGPWIVSADGSKRHLGGATNTQATWSPHGLYEAVVTGGRELAAIDPKGNVRWSITRGLIADPRWSSDGYRIAYRSGSSLRVVAGDGTGDRMLARRVAPIAAAWDGVTHKLAYADRHGRIHLVNADTGATVWISKAGPTPTTIAWEPGRRQLVALTSRALLVLDARDGSVFKEIPIGPSQHTLSVSPNGPVAVTTSSGAGQSTILIFHPQHLWLKARPIFHGAGEFNSLAWSPDGKWLLVSWASADQWVFIKLDENSQAARLVQAISSIAHQFHADRAPTLSGWCCAVATG